MQRHKALPRTAHVRWQRYSTCVIELSGRTIAPVVKSAVRARLLAPGGARSAATSALRSPLSRRPD
jgi:hypothetical protein